MKPNWLVTRGTVQIKSGEIKFIPIKIDNDAQDELKNYHNAMVRSDLYFLSGEIEMSVQIKNEQDKLQVLLGVDGDNHFNIGLNIDKYAYGISQTTGGRFQALSMQGPAINPPINEWLKLRIKYIGSMIEFYVNDVMVGKSNGNIHNSQVEIVYRGMGPATVKDISFLPSNPQAFIVMQFSEAYNSLYKEVIVPVCEEYGYDVVRADDMYTTGLIIEDITRAIQESSLVIADITPNNPNVYYEVGYAHGINKATILLSDKNREKLPFDISGFRLLFYENSIAGKPTVESALRKHLEAIKNA